MCEREREEPHCYRCTSPQLIALCVGVSPLYSTPDKMCVSVHDACNDKRPNKVRWACTVCLHHACHATPYASLISRNIWQNYKKIVFGLKSSNKPCDFGEQYCSAWWTWLCKIDHTTTFTSGPQNTSTVAMQTMTTEIWYQILNGFYRNTVYN